MFAGVKFISRDQIDKDELDTSSKEKKKSHGRKEKYKLKKKSSRDSSSDDELQRIKKRSKKKKWYSSDESSSSCSTESDSDDTSEQDKKKHRKRAWKKSERGEKSDVDKYGECLIDVKGSSSLSEKGSARKEMGLEWMLRPNEERARSPDLTVDKLPEEAPNKEMMKVNPKELNPYIKDNGSGYPDDIDGAKHSAGQLLSSSLVGDGGASWRLKALKRAKEQAAREGRGFKEVIEERWSSLGELTVSITSQSAAPSHAHLHAIKDRKRGVVEEQPTDLDRHSKRDYRKDRSRDVSFQHSEMRAPKGQDALSWRKRNSQNFASKDAGMISTALSSLNKFSSDGSFFHEVQMLQDRDCGASVRGNVESDNSGHNVAPMHDESSGIPKDGMSANQLAAKALQLRLKGKHEEAESLMQEAKYKSMKHSDQKHLTRPRKEGTAKRYVMQDITVRQKKREDDADMHLAHKIIHNKQYSISGQADDEYDYEEGPSRKARKKNGGDDHDISQKNTLAKHILTQQKRCLFCLENPNRPMHLVVSIANFTYLMLPLWQSVVPGHCCILPIQHESATRAVDDGVWTEIRNFKKCLIQMFAEKKKSVVFLETVIGLSQQRRHCMVECIPLPEEIFKQAPIYYKKAIDEAEDEWSQHNAKKLIDTTEKGLRNSIPKNFPYFHVEFGLDRGFVHVIEDEKNFRSGFGLNVIRGMLQLPEEDMYRNRRYESKEVQKQAVSSFSQEWDPFDWTKQLH